MTPTHSVKSGKRYRYYVSRALITEAPAGAMSGLRVPAAEIERIVVNRIRRLLAEPASLFEILTRPDAGEQYGPAGLLAAAQQRAGDWLGMSPLRQRIAVLALIRRVELAVDQLVIHLRPRGLAAFLEDRPAKPDPLADEPTLALRQPLQLRRTGKEVRMIVEPHDRLSPPAKPDPTLIKTIVKAHRFNNMLLRGGISRFAELAKGEKLHRSYCSQILRLAYLAPDITTAILDGRQPAGLTATMLIEHPALPLCWQQQRTALGFA